MDAVWAQHRQAAGAPRPIRAPDATDASGSFVALVEEALAGGRWTQVTSPNPGGHSVALGLSSVSAVSAKEAWAVDSANDGGTANRTLVEHVC